MGLNLWSSVAFLAGAIFLLVIELMGAFNKRKGDTITENWRWLDAWLLKHSPVLDWFWRIFTVGILTWASFHFIAGTR